MTKAEYQRYLKSPHWRAVRKRYRASKMPQTCVVCGATKVDLHHRYYTRIGRERLTDLVPLCRDHHAEAHRIRDAQAGKRQRQRATAKQLAYIRRLGGTPDAEMSSRAARKLTIQLQRAPKRERARKRKQAKGARAA